MSSNLCPLRDPSEYAVYIVIDSIKRVRVTEDMSRRINGMNHLFSVRSLYSDVNSKLFQRALDYKSFNIFQRLKIAHSVIEQLSYENAADFIISKYLTDNQDYLQNQYHQLKLLGKLSSCWHG